MGTDKRQRQKQNTLNARAERQRQEQRKLWRDRAVRYGGGIVIAVAAVVLIAQLQGGGSSSSTDTTVPTDNSSTVTTLSPTGGGSITGPTQCPPPEGAPQRITSFEQQPPRCIDPNKSYIATFDTTEGVIEVQLDAKNTPNTVNNFVVLSRYKYYDNTPVFRTDPSLDIIQAGGESNTASPGYTIEDEGNGYTYTEGDLAMARTGEPNSAGGQFFFVTGPKASVLDGQGTYVVFGKVTKGLDITKAILELNSGSGSLGGAPSRAVTIKSITITES